MVQTYTDQQNMFKIDFLHHTALTGRTLGHDLTEIHPTAF